MKRIIFLSFIFVSLLNFSIADELKPLVIDADLVDYNGKRIILQGNSTVDHELGKVEAQRITLIPENEGKKLRISFLKMNGEVKIALQDGGHLCCSEAEIDYHTLSGKFLSGNPEEYVVYSELLKGRDPKAATPLQVKSRDMSIRLQREDKQGPSVMVIQQITADNDVSVHYNQDFIALADHGLYERRELQGQEGVISSHAVTGMVSLYANEHSGICQVNNDNGDMIKADRITIDTFKRELQFDAPKGTIFTSKEGSAKSEIDFSCETMIWNEPQDLLILRDHVEVVHKGMGTLTNPTEIRVQRQLINGHKQVSLIDCMGNSVLTFQEEKKNQNHIITTHHRFVLDHQRLQAHMDSPRDANNHVLENLQVHFNDAMGDIYADEAFITYQEINKKMTPVKLLLKGNVWLLGRTSIDKDDPGKILQFAMADRLEYDIAAKEMLFLADFNKRVLFFDKSNNLQISAPSVKAKRDPQTHKDAIQGMGDVRFSFIEKEFDLLKKRFAELN